MQCLTKNSSDIKIRLKLNQTPTLIFIKDI
jgi:hypothetical protein